MDNYWRGDDSAVATASATAAGNAHCHADARAATTATSEDTVDTSIAVFPWLAHAIGRTFCRSPVEDDTAEASSSAEGEEHAGAMADTATRGDGGKASTQEGR